MSVLRGLSGVMLLTLILVGQVSADSDRTLNAGEITLAAVELAPNAASAVDTANSAASAVESSCSPIGCVQEWLGAVAGTSANSLDVDTGSLALLGLGLMGLGWARRGVKS